MYAMLQAEFAKQNLRQTEQMRNKKQQAALRKTVYAITAVLTTQQLELDAKRTKKLCQILNTPQINIVLIYIMTSIPYM